MYGPNRIDVAIELWLNHFVGSDPWIDKMALLWCSTSLTSIVLLILIMWFTIFDARRPGRLHDGHEMIFGAALFAMLATMAARLIAVTAPFRLRPIATPSLHFVLPAGGSLVLIHWSSFPSDHATLFFALAVGILPVSRRLGWFAVGLVAATCLALLYTGVHWPSDILAGALMGAGSAQLARLPAIRQFLRRNVETFYAARPASFLALFFLWSYETTMLFEDVRRLLFYFAHHA